MIQDILKYLLSVYKIMFQNLSSELYENIDDNKIIQILLTIIDNDEKNSELNVL